MKKYYLPYADADRVQWLDNFNNKMQQSYGKLFGILAAQLTALTNDTAAFAYIINMMEGSKTFLHNCTAYKEALRTEKSATNVQPLPLFVAPANPPIPVAPGIFDRVLTLVQQIKAHSAYTEAIGLDLGIVGANLEEGFETVKPLLKVNITGGWVNIKYTKSGTEGILLESQRGNDTAFSFLARITKSSYTDNRPNLTKGSPESRQYRAWYVVNDQVIGLVSDVVTIITNQ
jgi:hypothetical protein